MSGASTRLSVLPCGIVDERSLCRASLLITLSCDLGFPAIHQIIDYALPHIGPVYQDNGVSACRLVLFCAVAEPTWSKNAFSPTTDSSLTALRSKEPFCCESIWIFALNCCEKAVVICVDIAAS